MGIAVAQRLLGFQPLNCQNQMVSLPYRKHNLLIHLADLEKFIRGDETSKSEASEEIPVLATSIQISTVENIRKKALCSGHVFCGPWPLTKVVNPNKSSAKSINQKKNTNIKLLITRMFYEVYMWND